MKKNLIDEVQETAKTVSSVNDLNIMIKEVEHSYSEIAKENAKGAELSLDTATTGMAAPFHEGAARYYREHGITVKTTEED